MEHYIKKKRLDNLFSSVLWPQDNTYDSGQASFSVKVSLLPRTVRI